MPALATRLAITMCVVITAHRARAEGLRCPKGDTVVARPIKDVLNHEVGAIRTCSGANPNVPHEAELRYTKSGAVGLGTVDGGKRVGTWRWYRKTGAKLRTVEYANGRPHGTWTEYAADGSVVFEQPCEHGFPHGLRTSYDAKGNVITRSRWGAGKPRGAWEVLDAAGGIVDTLALDGDRLAMPAPVVPDGWWKRGRCPKGSKLEAAPPPKGQLVRCLDGAGKAQGPVSRWMHGMRESGMSIDSAMNGVWTGWLDDGMIVQTTWRAGVRHGRLATWWGRSLVSLGHVRAGKEEGTSTTLARTGNAAWIYEHRGGDSRHILRFADGGGPILSAETLDTEQLYEHEGP